MMTNNLVTSPTTGLTSLSSNSPPPPPNQIFEVNAVQSTSPIHSEGNKKTKNKPKNINNQTENEKTQMQPPTTEKQPQHKPKFPCLICVEDHYT
jgi:hypothetical protein